MYINIFLTFYVISNVVSKDISENVFGKDRDGLPAAFGDFNSDELTDVFITKNNGTILQILLASDKEPLLKKGIGMDCKFEGYRVTSVVPGDFDGDAFMDILITTQSDAAQLENSPYHDLRIIWGGGSHLNCSSDDLSVIATVKGHPLALDYNQDMIIDLFGINENNTRTFWVFHHNRSQPSEIYMDYKGFNLIRIPHSHSFLDMNGDYISDLLITTPNSFEVWYGNSYESGFSYKHQIELPIGVLNGHVGQSLFLDVELSGKLYLLLPYCFDKDCKNSTILLNDDGEWLDLLVDFEDDSHNMWGFNPPNSEVYTDTITMRGGDYNMDGYPDLLVTLQLGTGSDLQAFLLENIPCEEKVCTFNRKYKVLWNALGVFQKGTFLSVFYDFYQDGVLDYILLQRNSTTKEYKLCAFKNNLDYDANFIKVMVLTGLTNKIVPVAVGALGKKKGTYGTNLPGPRISYHMLSQEGLPRDGVCTQLPQSAYYAMNLPYSIFGLDRTPNFVDVLMVGLSNRSKTWTQLIPNSQVVVIPWPRDDPSQWKVQLFVTPSKLILKSVWVFTGICGLIIIIVGFLHWREKCDDETDEPILKTDECIVSNSIDT